MIKISSPSSSSHTNWNNSQDVATPSFSFGRRRIFLQGYTLSASSCQSLSNKNQLVLLLLLASCSNFAIKTILIRRFVMEHEISHKKSAQVFKGHEWTLVDINKWLSRYVPSRLCSTFRPKPNVDREEKVSHSSFSSPFRPSSSLPDEAAARSSSQ